MVRSAVLPALHRLIFVPLLPLLLTACPADPADEAADGGGTDARTLDGSEAQAGRDAGSDGDAAGDGDADAGGDDGAGGDVEVDGDGDVGGDGEADSGTAGYDCASPPQGMLCVPGGSYIPGSSSLKIIGPLLFDISEATVSEYAECVLQGVCDMPETGGLCTYLAPGKSDHPVTCLFYQDAETYCAWRGKRLPSEWEWEWAARGGEEARPYPWGTEAPNEDLACFGAGGTGVSSCAVTEHSPAGDSVHGLRDMSGNAAEWTSSWFDVSASSRTYRGGSFASGEAALRVDARDGYPTDGTTGGLGVRCVLDL